MLVIGPATTVPIPTRRFARDCRLLFQANNALAPWHTITRRNKLTKDGIRASAGELLGPVKPAKLQLYHPLEDISDSEESDENGDAILKPAETSRTIIVTNSKALLMFSGLVSDGVYENVFLPDLPYVKGEHGNIYFQVKSDEDILEDLASGDNLVQVIIGLDTTEMVNEMGSSLGLSDDDDDDFEDEDSDFEDDESDNYGKDWVSVLEDDGDSDGAHSLGDWAKLETMRLSHPMDFAKHLADFVSDVPINYMEEPPSGISIHGLLRPAFVDENSKEELQKDENFGNGTSYYKLEMIKLQLISAHGNQAYVEVEDFSRCEPDAVAHSAGKIISRLKSGGDKMTRAFKSLCWRCKGIQAEEVALIGVDSLGFYLRVCSGRQVQTLRFTFKNRASSEYGVESQLNGLLFPLNVGQQQKKEVKL